MEEGANVKAGAANSLQTSGAALGAFGGKKQEEKNSCRNLVLMISTAFI